MAKKDENPFGPKGWTPDRLGSLKGKTYVITGANAGAGFEASKVFISKGARVVMLNRNPQKSEAAIEAIKAEFGAESDASFIQMDLAVLGSVREAAEAVKAQVPHIDALLCNAAIAQVATQELTVDGFESQLGVNHFGHFYGPTQRAEMVGRIGECPLQPHVLDRETAAKLWTLSEEKTGFHWQL